MSKHTGLAGLVVACALLAAAFLLLVGPAAMSQAEPMVEKIEVDPVALTLSEPSGSDLFTLTLTSLPIADVWVPLEVSNGQCSVLPDLINLNSTNWATGVTATVTAVDDAIADGPQTCWANAGKSTSTDPRFNGLSVRDVKATVNDDDVPGITVIPTSMTVAEPTGSDIFVLTLTSQPIAAVSVPLTATNGQCTVLPNSVILDAANWATGVTAAVTAVEDLLADGTQTCPVQTGPASSTDSNYDGRNALDVTVTVLDYNLLGVTVLPTTLAIAEPAGSKVFTLTLTGQPIATVSIPLSAASDQCSVLPSSIILDAANWATGMPAIVTAIDDLDPDGPQACPIQTGVTSSSDPKYNGLSVPDVTVTVYDNDIPSIVVGPTSLTMAEPTGSDTFLLTLTRQPTTTVSVPLTATNGQCLVSPKLIILDNNSWATGAPATVAAVDDLIADGQQTCPIQTGRTRSTGHNFGGLPVPDVSVTVYDNDLAGIAVAPTSLIVSEPAGSDIFTVTLTSQPIATVLIPLQASNGQCSVLPNPIMLDDTNWATGAPATVGAVDDFIADGSQTCTAQTGLTSSADPNYNGLSVSDVTVTVNDNDVAGVDVEPTSLTISEPDGSARFTVTLTSQPTATVYVFPAAANNECTVLPHRIPFNAITWTTGATVTVTAFNDGIKDGTQLCPVDTVTSSADPNYDGLEVETVNVTVHDIPVTSLRLPLIVRRWPPIPDAPTLQPIGNPDGDGSYTISWTPEPPADYILQESKHSSMSGATQIYSGPSTSYPVAGRGAARYYYRVKAYNVWGESGWSSVQWVDVLWEAEPNDEAPGQANGPIVSGLTYNGTFPSDADSKDYFYFDLPAAHSVELWLTNIPAGQNYDLILRDAALTAVGYSGNPGNAAEYIKTGTLPVGRYYVQVYHRSSGGSTQPYHLKTVY